MRIPVVPQISTKDGVSAKNARLTNCLKESKKGGDKAVVRPGLVTSDTYSGLGNGLIPFDGRLLVIYDDTVTDVEEESYPWPLDSDPWSAGATYGYGDSVWYGGVMFFSQTSGNVGNTPGSSTQWEESYQYPDYDAGTTYAIGDPVRYGGVTYYSYSPSNVGNTPGTCPVWSVSSPGSSRWVGDVFGTTPAGDECASAEAAAYDAFLNYPYKSCATKAGGTYSWREYEYVLGAFFYWHQWADIPPYDCSGSPQDLGIVGGGTVTQTV